MLWANAETETRISEVYLTFLFDNAVTEIKEENKRVRISRQKRKELFVIVKTDNAVRKGNYTPGYVKNLISRLL